MEQQEQLSIDAHQINEGYSLGERYHLGQLQGEYYVAYTQADVRRHRFHILFITIGAIYGFGMIAYTTYLLYFLFNNSTPHSSFPSYAFIMAINPFLMLYGNAQRRKWGNRPIITPRNRHLRVYVYQDGLVKQTNQKSAVIRWSDLYRIKYEPLLPINPKQSTSTAKPMAGIQLLLSNKHTIKLNGALRNLDNLAQQINGKNEAARRFIPMPHFP